MIDDWKIDDDHTISTTTMTTKIKKNKKIPLYQPTYPIQPPTRQLHSASYQTFGFIIYSTCVWICVLLTELREMCRDGCLNHEIDLLAIP